MFLYTLLFTLQDKDPSTNKYVDMFFIWLTFVKRNAGLLPTDTVCILIDERTLEFLNSNSIFDTLLGEPNFRFQFRNIPVPSSISEGLAERYKFFSNDIHMFLDLDILIQKPIQQLVSSFQGSSWFACMPEGKLLNTDYGGNVLPSNDSYAQMPGFTAGWFAFTPCPDVLDMFCKIQKEILQNKETPFYTIDQPFFNKWIVHLLEHNTPVLLFLLQEDFYKTNEIITNSDETCIFWNSCGEPGNGSLHFQKLLRDLCLSYAESKVAPLEHPNPPQELSAALQD